jgi:hypothetical protein
LSTATPPSSVSSEFPNRHSRERFTEKFLLAPRQAQSERNVGKSTDELHS